MNLRCIEEPLTFNVRKKIDKRASTSPMMEFGLSAAVAVPGDMFGLEPFQMSFEFTGASDVCYDELMDVQKI